MLVLRCCGHHYRHGGHHRRCPQIVSFVLRLTLYIYIYITANCKLQDSVCNMIEVADTGLVTRLPRRRRDFHALVEAETIYRTRLITKALMPKRPRGRLTRTRQKHCKHDVIRYDVARHARENPAAYVCAYWWQL